MGEVVAICISEKKGTEKNTVNKCTVIENHGIKGDAHAGNWHRQISLLSYEKIEDFKNRGVNVDDGAFGENLIIKGIDFSDIIVGSKVQIGEVLLEVTQLGKKCHNHCRIYEAVGDCIMPREGVFAIALVGGEILVGEKVSLL